MTDAPFPVFAKGPRIDSVKPMKFCSTRQSWRACRTWASRAADGHALLNIWSTSASAHDLHGILPLLSRLGKLHYGISKLSPSHAWLGEMGGAGALPGSLAGLGTLSRAVLGRPSMTCNSRSQRLRRTEERAQTIVLQTFGQSRMVGITRFPGNRCSVSLRCFTDVTIDNVCTSYLIAYVLFYFL